MTADAGLSEGVRTLAARTHHRRYYHRLGADHCTGSFVALLTYLYLLEASQGRSEQTHSLDVRKSPPLLKHGRENVLNYQ